MQTRMCQKIATITRKFIIYAATIGGRIQLFIIASTKRDKPKKPSIEAATFLCCFNKLDTNNKYVVYEMNTLVMNISYNRTPQLQSSHCR